MNVVAVVSRQLSVIIGYYTEHNYAELGRGKSNSYVNCRCWCRLKMVDCVVQGRDYTHYTGTVLRLADISRGGMCSTLTTVTLGSTEHQTGIQYTCSKL